MEDPMVTIIEEIIAQYPRNGHAVHNEILREMPNATSNRIYLELVRRLRR